MKKINIGGVVALEGNGQRPSHIGNGWKETETMYTLNHTEVHGVAYAVDLYNQTTGGVFKTLCSARNDAEHIPCVIVGEKDGQKNISVSTESGNDNGK